MEQLPESKQINYVIEHCETEVSKWTLCEYVHMIMILNDLYCSSAKPNKLILANFPFKAKFKEGTLQDDEYGTLKHT
jgi:ribosome biogenesis SPOUT family RNA methylase Rps3